MLSIVIASRQPEYLQKTIDDLLGKAEGPVEVIVVLDGIWPDPMLKNDSRVVIIHQGEIHNNLGMRAAINAGIDIAKGEYIFQIDEHCLVSQGYDIRLSSICQDDWVIIPRRKRLDAENWKIAVDRRPDIDYMYTEYPYAKPFDKTQGLHGAIWNRPERADIEVDDTPTMQGSAYFLKKSYWNQILPNGMDDEKYGPFTMEAQEISMAAWLSGGRVVVDKGCYYAHWHKGSKGKGYGFSTAQYKKHSEQNEKGRLYAINYWLYTKDYKYDWDWFVTEKFPDMPGWSADWKERVEVDRLKDYSTLGYKDDPWLVGLREKA